MSTNSGAESNLVAAEALFAEIAVGAPDLSPAWWSGATPVRGGRPAYRLGKRWHLLGTALPELLLEIEAIAAVEHGTAAGIASILDR